MDRGIRSKWRCFVTEYRAAESEPLSDQAKRVGQEAAEQVQQQASQATATLREQAKSQMSGQKERAAGQLQGVVSALEETAGALRQQDRYGIADYTDGAAQQLQRIAGQLEQKDIDQLLREAGNAVRRRPGLFLGGAFAVGILGARFLKSSSPETTSSSVPSYEFYGETAREPALEDAGSPLSSEGR